MRAALIIGILLAALGVVSLFYGGIPVRAERQNIHVGPIEGSIEHHKSIDIPLGLSIAAIAGGAVLIVLGSRTR